MDWRYSLFVAEQGLFAIVPLCAALVVLLLAASPGRRIIACSPVLASLTIFAVSCLVAALPREKHWLLVDYLPLLGLILTIALLVPSILSLRRRWFGIVHVLTLIGALLSWLVASMAISHDWL